MDELEKTYRFIDPKMREQFVLEMDTLLIEDWEGIADVLVDGLLKLKSFTKATLKHCHGWIATSRLEEKVGELRAARQLSMKGCEECPKSEDMWLEACRLASLADAKDLVERGLRWIPMSVNLWMPAAKLESDYINKLRLLKEATEKLPNEPIYGTLPLT
ncbi:putative protein STABILIZED1 [Salvia divinorum]|uniref:Uncharacterized protein n=1 Tax=Salvia divinorum TaxID=28513 RepID=A0ABD1I734_SALDI